MDDATRTELEAAAFRRLVQHFRERVEVQNIDLMNLAGFCRNCLSKWYMAAAKEKGIEMSYDEAREIVYGMPYEEWKAKYQTEASHEQRAKFEEESARSPHDHGSSAGRGGRAPGAALRYARRAQRGRSASLELPRRATLFEAMIYVPGSNDISF